MASENTEYSSSQCGDIIMEKTGELTEFLRQTEDYKRYEKALAALKKNRDEYRQLNVFRKKNLELQLNEQDEHYYEMAEALYAEYKDILMESVVMEFLASEQRICKMMRGVYSSIGIQMDLDVAYLD